MRPALLVAFACLSLLRAAAAEPLPRADHLEFFESKVRPLLETKCSACHGGQVQMAGLNLTTAEGFFRGADTGPVVAGDDLGASRLIQAVGYQGKFKMPPTGRLSDEEIAALEAWVKMGAPWPTSGETKVAEQDSESPRKAAGPQWSEQKLAHWAFQPVSNPVPPPVSNQKWVQKPLDSFILARLEAAGIEPAAPADKMTLLRRAKFDLHGLPPTKDEIREFLNDNSPEAFARLIHRLLLPRDTEKSGDATGST